MFRALIFAALSVSALPALAETKEQKADRCAIQAGIVQAAITQRSEGRNQNRATKAILKSDPIKGSKYEANVDVLVAWIYSLPDAQLVPETVSTFETACLEYQ